MTKRKILTNEESPAELLLKDGPAPVYLYPNLHLHSFCLALYIRGGALYEAPEENGITHFWEHLVFRRLNWKYGGSLYERLDRMGMDFTGCTYREFVQLKITGSPRFLPEAIQMMLDVFLPVRLPASELSMERRRVKAEIREEDERNSLEYFSNQIVWEGSPASQSIAGSPSVLNRIGLKKMAEFQERLLSCGNLFFYVTGNVRPQDLSPLCAGIDALSLSRQPLKDNMASVPSKMFSREGEIAVKRSAYTFVRLSFDVDAGRSPNALLDLLYDILFSGESCRIFQELSEKTGFIYSYDARFERYRNVGSLYFQYEVSARNLLPSLQKLAELLRRLKTGLTDELDRVLAPYTCNGEMLLDDVEDLNWTMAYECHILKEPYRSIAERRAAYESVTVSQMDRLLAELLRPQNMVLSFKGNPAALEKYRKEIQRLMSGI